jgi:nucleotide-binding universal stress UspA family protein
MIGFKRILFPVDFSAQCRAVVPSVKSMAEKFGAEVIVMHVVGLPPNWFGSPEGAAWTALINADRLRVEARVALDRFIAQEFSGPLPPVTWELAEGDAAHQIVDYAQDDGADLIMMPTHGYGPLRALLLGSTTAKVLHDAHCPVWTGVHAGQAAAHAPGRWKRMLCAVDTGDKDLGTLRWAAGFAKEQELELRLVHVVVGVDSLLAKDRDPGLYEFLFNVAREGLAKLQAEAGTNFEACVLPGSIAYAVHQSAIGHDADLIVIGRGVIQKTLGRLRSSAYSIIRAAPCPVISI